MENFPNSIYVGEHYRTIDDKRRVLLPAKWRFGSGDREIYIAIPNPSGCITIYPPEMVIKLKAKAADVSLGDKKGQKTLTKLFSKADQLTCDSQGRISINLGLSNHAHLSKDIVIVGNFITFSIWDPERYKQYFDSADDPDDEISIILTQLGL